MEFRQSTCMMGSNIMLYILVPISHKINFYTVWDGTDYTVRDFFYFFSAYGMGRIIQARFIYFFSLHMGWDGLSRPDFFYFFIPRLRQNRLSQPDFFFFSA